MKTNNSNPRLNRAILLALTGLGLALLTGCTSYREYRAMRRAYDEQTLSDYYHHQIVDVTDSVQVAADATDPFLNEVQEQLLQFQEQWETKLDTDTITTAKILPLTDDERKTYQALATSNNLDAALKEGVALPKLLGLAYARNPDLKAAESQLRAAIQKYPQAVALDDILNQYNAFTKQLHTKVGPQRHKEMMAMTHPFPDTLAIKGKIVNEEVAIARQNYEITLRNLIAELRKAYYGYAYISAALNITAENQQLLEQIVKIAQQKYKVDKGKYGHVIMGQVELSKLSDRILTLQNKRRTIAARINTLLNRDTEAPLGPADAIQDEQPEADLHKLYAAALKHRQEVRRLALKLNRMELMIDMASRMAYPDVTTGASYLETRMGRKPAFMARRTLNESQTAWVGQRDAYIREMRLSLTAMREKLTALEDKTRFGVKKQHLDLNTARRSIALYRQSLLPQAKQAVEAAQTAYTNAEIDFIGFVDAQRTLLQLQLGEKKALRNYRSALAELERLVGRSLKRTALELPTAATSDLQETREP